METTRAPRYWLSTAASKTALSRVRTPFFGSYAEACLAADQVWRETGLSCGVCDNEHCVRFWYFVSLFGVAEDRNAAGGVNLKRQLER